MKFRVGILAFHKALVDKPRDPAVVAAFSLAVHSGGSLLEAVDIARKISQPNDLSFQELLESQGVLSAGSLMDEVIDLAGSVKASLLKMTDENFVSQAMIKYPQAPCSDLVRNQRFIYCFVEPEWFSRINCNMNNDL